MNNFSEKFLNRYNNLIFSIKDLLEVLQYMDDYYEYICDKYKQFINKIPDKNHAYFVYVSNLYDDMFINKEYIKRLFDKAYTYSRIEEYTEEYKKKH